MDLTSERRSSRRTQTLYQPDKELKCSFPENCEISMAVKDMQKCRGEGCPR